MKTVFAKGDIVTFKSAAVYEYDEYEVTQVLSNLDGEVFLDLKTLDPPNILFYNKPASRIKLVRRAGASEQSITSSATPATAPYTLFKDMPVGVECLVLYSPSRVEKCRRLPCGGDEIWYKGQKWISSTRKVARKSPRYNFQAIIIPPEPRVPKSYEKYVVNGYFCSLLGLRMSVNPNANGSRLAAARAYIEWAEDGYPTAPFND